MIALKTRCLGFTGRPEFLIQTVRFDTKLIGSQNLRERWQVRAARVRHERKHAGLRCLVLQRPTQWPCTVTLIRIGPRNLDGDNLQGAFKGTRDGIADWLGVNDGDETKVLWKYAQERGPYGVRIEIAAHYAALGANK
jgi:hypothetical protein